MRKAIIAAAAGVAFALGGGAVSAQAATAVYEAQLTPLNASVTGTPTQGTVRMVERNGMLTVDIKVSGAPANTEHWQHFHGFTTGNVAVCPTALQDTNHDGVVDLIETGVTSGTTMVPFIQHPATMDIPHGAYPTANARGSYHYHTTVGVNELQSAFAQKFPGQDLNLDRRVVFIHGVPNNQQLPSTVQSLGPIPAQVTIPIACGVITRVE